MMIRFLSKDLFRLNSCEVACCYIDTVTDGVLLVQDKGSEDETEVYFLSNDSFFDGRPPYYGYPEGYRCSWCCGRKNKSEVDFVNTPMHGLIDSFNIKDLYGRTFKAEAINE